MASYYYSNKNSRSTINQASFQEYQYNQLIDKYLDIDCDDQVLFMSPKGDANSNQMEILNSKFSFQSFPKLIEKRFCLLEPIDSCQVNLKKSKPPSEYFFSRVPAEDLFEFTFSSHHPGKKYNKIIVNNCLSLFDKQQVYFCKFLNSLLKNTMPFVSCILLIQRVNNNDILRTMPFYEQVCYIF